MDIGALIALGLMVIGVVKLFGSKESETSSSGSASSSATTGAAVGSVAAEEATAVASTPARPVAKASQAMTQPSGDSAQKVGEDHAAQAVEKIFTGVANWLFGKKR
jgi:hypothetical protein